VEFEAIYLWSTEYLVIEGVPPYSDRASIIDNRVIEGSVVSPKGGYGESTVDRLSSDLLSS
jgi:hypothetical protein